MGESWSLVNDPVFGGTPATESRTLAVGTIDQELLLPDTPYDVLTIPYVAGGGLIILAGSIAVEFDGMPAVPAILQMGFRFDDAPLPNNWESSFPAAQTPFTVAVPFWNASRPPAGPHALTIILRNAGLAPSKTTVRRSLLWIGEVT